MNMYAFRPSVGEEEIEMIREAFERRWLGMGEMTKRFEAAVAERIDIPFVIAVNCGTAALQLALEVLDLEPDSEVLLPSMTFVASPQAVCNAGLKPVFCDIHPETLNLDVDDAESRITPRTKAVMPVHYAGEACDMTRLQARIGDRGIVVVEDAAHAFGSTCHGTALGTIGDLGCFSFNAIKNVTCGEGGAIATRSEETAQRLQNLRCLGIDHDGWSRQNTARPWAYRVTGSGHRVHMSDINAAIGLAQLEKMERFRIRKLTIAQRYDEALADIPVCRPLLRSEGTFPFSYVVRVLDGRRDEFIEHMRGIGVSLLVQFIPNHLQPAFADIRTPLPVTEQMYGEIVSLPLFYELSDEDQDRVIQAMRDFFGCSKSASPSVVEVIETTPGPSRTKVSP